MKAPATTTVFPSTIRGSIPSPPIGGRRHQVSRSLLFEYAPIDQPAATDPVERSTWCSLRIRVGERYASRIWDKTLQSERTSLYLPAFPVAVWIGENWWSLLNELCSW